MSLRANRSPMATFLPEGWAIELGIIPVESTEGVGSSAGAASVSAGGSSIAVGVGDADGAASVGGVGYALAEGVGSASGSSSAQAFGYSVAIGVGSAAGTSTAASPNARALAIGTGESHGTSSADATGNALAIGVGEAHGTSSADAAGSAIAIGVGESHGTSAARAFTFYAFADYVSTLDVRDHVASLRPLDHVASLMLVGMSYQIGQGDLAPDIIFEAGVNGAPENLSDALSYKLRWWKPSGSIVEVTITPLDLALGQFKRTWAPGDTDEIGTHSAKLIVTRGNGDQQTFPSDGSHLRWRVT